MFLDGDGPLDRLGDSFPTIVADLARQIGAVRLENRGAGVAGFVDSVPESHDPLLARQGIVDPAFGVLGRADRFEHFPRFFIGPAVERALQGADGRDDPRVDV